MSGLFFQLPTIAAIATAPGAAGVAIIRISGAEAWPIICNVFKTSSDLSQSQANRGDGNSNKRFAHGRFYHGWIVDPLSQQPIDEVLVLFFKAPKSFTGEDVIEIHCHGGQVVPNAILALCFQQGALPAGPGEFTRRAFLAGKLDLTQAESIMDVVAAQGEAMTNLALSNLRTRSLGQAFETIRNQIMQIQSLIVASVDFPDEVDEPDRNLLSGQLFEILAKTEALLLASDKNRFLQEGLKLAIVGLPNAGKSSLFNALLAMERAIVTEMAGTTRDVISETVSIGGVPLTLFDTAGIREAENTVETMGIERAWQTVMAADAVLLVCEVSALPQHEGHYSDADQEILNQLPKPPLAILANKIDCYDLPVNRTDVVPIAAQTGEGLQKVHALLATWVGSLQQRQGELTVILNQRQKMCLQAFLGHLQHAQKSLETPFVPLDVVTVPLTDSLLALDELTGRNATEEVLDKVFSQFCVGK